MEAQLREGLREAEAKVAALEGRVVAEERIAGERLAAAQVRGWWEV